MNWASVKNMLILMLVAANVFLLYNISVQRRSLEYIDEDEVADAVSLLTTADCRLISAAFRCGGSTPKYMRAYTARTTSNRTAELLSGSKRQNATIIPNGMMIVTENDDLFEFDNSLGFSYTKITIIRPRHILTLTRIILTITPRFIKNPIKVRRPTSRILSSAFCPPAMAASRCSIFESTAAYRNPPPAIIISRRRSS